MAPEFLVSLAPSLKCRQKETRAAHCCVFREFQGPQSICLLLSTLWSCVTFVSDIMSRDFSCAELQEIGQINSIFLETEVYDFSLME